MSLEDAQKYARMVKKWSPAGPRMRGEALDRWREGQLRSVLARHDLERHFGEVKHLVHKTVEDRTRAARRADHERYVRACGRGR